MVKQSIGAMMFLLGVMAVVVVNVQDFFKIAMSSIVGEPTVLALCLRVAQNTGFDYPMVMAASLWLLPVFFTVVGFMMMNGRRG